ncbi:MAG: Cof-type HAD-IIB family hydrolase [Meiothermus ruber]|uniref:Cof-type HAD-IIB family hydrolase n=1 Tax=Meiothermus sp. TaxID=1955249 RepID=UPI0025E46A97|nr:Cof-type HAD-IIB family hydrolase [Meiothermus sp.]MCS7069065.1 Cof-type HAD-IIB family hydrolase [Meiothermus sp.]MCX7803205.1 Cof-type HAD-IIB family hydrolase [Meiothermus ruber]
MIKLVALDLDGTFYAGRTLGVPESAWAAIERGREAGLRFAVCTGRPQGGVGLEYARRLQPDGPHVFNDGASICDAWGRSLHAEPLPRLAEIIAIARRHGLPFDLMGADGGRYYESDLMPPELLTHIEITGVEARSAQFEEIRETLVRLWFVVPDLSLWETVKPDLAALSEIDLAEYLSPREVVTGVIRKGVSKASGLRWLAEYYAISMDEIAMIGDSHNDLEAIRDAGLGIAMGNAVDEIIAIADHVTAHVREHGFAQAIEHILLLNEQA